MDSLQASLSSAYVQIGTALGLRPRREAFDSLSPESPQIPVSPEKASSALGVVGGLFSLIIFLVIAFAANYGAARLSWCYNKSMGASDGVATMWSILCFFFSGIYYPVYSLFLFDCGLPKQIGAGRRR